jgi:hypothetical protein
MHGVPDPSDGDSFRLNLGLRSATQVPIMDSCDLVAVPVTISKVLLNCSDRKPWAVSCMRLLPHRLSEFAGRYALYQQ